MTLVETIERIGDAVDRRSSAAPATARRSLPAPPAFRAGATGSRSSQAVLEDPFGLAAARSSTLPGTAAIVVFPRLVDLDRLFSEGGLGAHQGRRILLRRPVGYDVHGVREYEHGESLRRVHWPTTARRGAADGQGARGLAA